MRGILIVVALAASFAVQAVSASPDCIEGYWDLGKNAAAMGFQCGQEGQWIGPNEGRLFFCQRQTLLSEGVCTRTELFDRLPLGRTKYGLALS